MLRQIAALAVFLGGVAALAQDSATLTVTVFDPSAAVVPGAKITLTDLHRGTSIQMNTGENGFAVFDFLPPGNYSLVAEKSGFEKYQVNQLSLQVRDRQTFRVELKVAVPGTSVQVTAQAQALSSGAAEGASLDQDFIQDLPDNGRNAESLIFMAPGIVPATDGSGGFDANGLRSTTNYYTLDGVSLNQSPSGGGAPGTGSAGGGGFGRGGFGGGGGATALGGANASTSLISIDSMQEMKIQTSSFAPEFGRSPGAQIVMTSRGGTNNLHGTLYDYIRSGAFDANDWFANAGGYGKGSEHQERPGGVLGGPLTKDKTFFFIAFEKLSLTSPESLVADVPDIASRATARTTLLPYLNAFPIPNSAALGLDGAVFNAITSNPADSSSASIRVDHILNPRTTLFARYSLTPSNSQQRGTQFSTPNILTEQSSRSQLATVGATHEFGDGILNDLRVNYSTATATGFSTMDNYGGAVPLTDSEMFPAGVTTATGAFSLNVLGFAGYSFGGHSDNRQQQFNGIDSLSKVYGRHNIKTGVDFREILQTTYRNPYSVGVSFNGVSNTTASGTANLYALLTGDALNVQVASSVPEVYPTYRNVSIYGQDTFRATERTTVTYGLRWDLNPAPTAREGPQPFALSSDQLAGVTQNQPIYATQWHNFAPRVGIAYLSDDAPGHEMTLRAGFGMFYDVGYGVVGQAFFGAPYADVRTASEIGFPLAPGDLVPPVLPPTRPYGQILTGESGLLSPLIYQWNGTWEKNFGVGTTVSVSLVGSKGNNLLRTSTTPSYTAAYDILQEVTNGAESDYDGLQVQFRKRLSRTLQAQLSYTWSHSIDSASSDSGFGGGFATLFGGERGDSDYDIRQNVTFSGSWRLPSPQGRMYAPIRDWYLDFVASAHTGLPFDLSAVSSSTSAATGCNTTSTTNGVSTTGLFANIRPSYVGGAIWIDDPGAPDGRELNSDAFITPCGYSQGNMGRNELRGFGFAQVDLALRKVIPISERYKFSIGLEAFNALNHPNFANPAPEEGANLASPDFGVVTQMLNQSFGGGVNSLYRSGGPRSMELALRLQF
ncbi:MAG TPA: TonB-dependent receptor [Bryobacteraceae bacterium]|nr:TonB-dependent receptor [Bryobacteraceae bacterium]